MRELLETTVLYMTSVLQLLILVRCIASFIFPNARNQFLYVVFILTEPILAPIRRLLEMSPLGGRGMMIDLSPIFSFLALNLIGRILVAVIDVIFI